MQLLPRQPFKCSKVSCRYDFSSDVNEDILFWVSNGSDGKFRLVVGSHSKFQYVALVTYPEIVESYNASGELAVKKVMGRIDCSHTRVGIVVRIHAETK